MKRSIAMILICLLVAPPASAGQKANKPISWEQAKKLKAGTEIDLTVTNAQPTKVRFLFADDAVLLTLNPTSAKQPERIERALVSLGARWYYILNQGAAFTSEQLRVSQEGVFDGDQKLAELADVVQQTPRANVTAIAAQPKKRHIGLIVVLSVVGVLFAVGIAARCSEGGC
jgi:hypothetical protein